MISATAALLLAACSVPMQKSASIPQPASELGRRPAYNTGTGFFVLNGKLYDPDGNEFRIRGVDRVHYDSPSQPGISNSHANTVRLFVQTNFGQTPAGLVNIVRTQHIDFKEVPIPTAPNVGTTSTATSCDASAADLQTVVSTWVAQASLWTTLNKYMIVNIANEWGPANSTVWRDSYISAIAQMRAAGYLGPLLIDAGGCGQDINDLLNYATAVFNSDPQKNVMFGFHLYGNTTLAQMPTYFAQMQALSASAGMVFIIGEFGPGRGIGPSPTMITPGQVIQAAEAAHLGWLVWAWDDNDLGGGKSNNDWFSMTYSGPGIYTRPADLTDYGQDVVLNPTYGLAVLARPASVFKP